MSLILEAPVSSEEGSQVSKGRLEDRSTCTQLSVYVRVIIEMDQPLVTFSTVQYLSPGGTNSLWINDMISNVLRNEFTG